MPVRFTNEDRVINPPQSSRNSPRISVTPRTRQSGKESRSPKTHTSGRKRKTKVKNAKRSKRGSQKKRGRRASKRQRGGVECTPDEAKIKHLQSLLNPDEDGGKLFANNFVEDINNPKKSIKYMETLEAKIIKKASASGLKFCDEDGKKNSKGETLGQYIERKHDDSDSVMRKKGINDTATLLKACLAFIVASKNGFPTFWTNQ